MATSELTTAAMHLPSVAYACASETRLLDVYLDLLGQGRLARMAVVIDGRDEHLPVL